MKKKDVSIIILNYNDYDTTTKIIELIKDFKDLNHIVVVDNNSSDGSYEILKKYNSEKIDVIKNAKNGGYAQGNNFGAKYALDKYDSDYIIIANPDVIFENDIIDKMIEEFLNDDSVGIVAPKIAPPSYITYYKYNLFECICSLFLVVTKLKTKLAKEKVRVGITEMFPGCFFMIDSKVFKEVNGFDEHTFLYLEETILNKRIKKIGKYSKIIGSCSYIHNHSVTIKKNYKSKVKQFKVYLNSLRYYVNEYLKINFLQRILFNIFVFFAYIEWYIYDMVNRLKYKLKH